MNISGHMIHQIKSEYEGYPMVSILLQLSYELFLEIST